MNEQEKKLPPATEQLRLREELIGRIEKIRKDVEGSENKDDPLIILEEDFLERTTQSPREIEELLKLAKAIEQIEKNIQTDFLTGLHNRSFCEEAIKKQSGGFKRFLEAQKRGEEGEMSTSLIILDIDNFKKINDTYGHPRGDEVLKQLAQILEESVRSLDICCRYGGEEFTIILPDTTLEEAKKLAERIREKIEKEIKIEEKSVTVSLGVAAFNKKCQELEAIIENADKALYRAKREGKNKVVVFGLEPENVNAT